MEINRVLHDIAQGFMVPAMVILVALLVISVVCVGSLIAEAIMERRRFKPNTSQAVNDIYDASYGEVVPVIQSMGLLGAQKRALLTVARNMGLPDDDLFALAKSEMARVDSRQQLTVKCTEMISKIGPMMGLVCTLIPLGPGIVAMGEGDVDLLSNAMLVAFDGTVTGLIAAMIAMVVTTVRKHWYGQYMVALESVMDAVLEKAEEARAEGVRLPHGSAEAVRVSSRGRASGGMVEDDLVGAVR